MNNPLVSVIMPLYNAEKYVAESIESIISQTYTFWELIIVNDGSTDKSLEVAQSFASDKIKIFTQDNKGASAARNYGLREAKGEYIQFLDADDLLSANKIESQLKVLKGKQDYIAVCNCVHFFDGEDVYAIQPKSDEAKYLYTTNNSVDFLINLYGGNGEGGMITVHSWLTPLNLITKAGFWDEELSLDDDGEFFCRVILQSKSILLVDNVYNYYRKYYKGKNLAGLNTHKGMTSALNATNLKLQYLIGKSFDNRINKAFALNYFRLAVSCYPAYKDISAICITKVAELGGTSHMPVIGGKFIEFIKKLLGWKIAKTLTYYINFHFRRD